MKRRTLLLTGLVVTTISLTTLAGCGNQTNPASENGKKVLTMVTSPDYPPYEYYDTAGERKIVGFDVDIANYITKQLGYELKINESDFNGLIPALQAKRADFVMAGMTPTPERQQNVDFSTLYYDAKNTIVAPASSNLTTTQALAGKTVGVQLGSIQEGDAKKLAQTVQGMQVKQLNKVPEIIQEIKAKRIDAAIVEDTVARGFIAANPDLQFNIIPSEGPSGSAIAFPKGSPLVAGFNQVLAQMKQNGELERLAKKWFSQSVAASASPTSSPASSSSTGKTPAHSP